MSPQPRRALYCLSHIDNGSMEAEQPSAVRPALMPDEDEKTGVRGKGGEAEGSS